MLVKTARSVHLKRPRLWFNHGFPCKHNEEFNERDDAGEFKGNDGKSKENANANA